MNPVTQAKVLRALEGRTVERLGGNRVIPVDVRILSATHRDIAAEVAAGRFRQDLFFRLKVVIVEIPLCACALRTCPCSFKPFWGSMPPATRGRACPWRPRPWTGSTVIPGRETSGSCATSSRAVSSLSRSSTIQVQDLPPEIRDLPARSGMGPGGPSFHEGGEPEHPLGNWLSLPYREARKQFETDYIAARLRDNGGNVSRTAAQIGLHRQSLHQKLRELGIESRHLGKSAGR